MWNASLVSAPPATVANSARPRPGPEGSTSEAIVDAITPWLAAFARADRVYEHRFTTSMVHAGYTEPRAAVASEARRSTV